MHSKRNKELKKRFVEWSSSSTSHGYPNIFRTDKWPIKIMWLFFLLLSTGVCFYMVTKSVTDYLNHEVVTKIRVFNEQMMEFPTITICNLNPFTKKASLEYINTLFDRVNNQIDDNEDLYTSFLMIAKNMSTFNDTIKEFTPSLNEMIFSCEMVGIDCDLDEFESFYMFDYGTCFRYNSGKSANNSKLPIKKSYFPGKRGGLNLILAVDKTRNVLGIPPVSGIKIFIDNSSFYPNYFQNGIDLQTGAHTNIALKKIINERVPEPYSECKKKITSQTYKNLINMDKEYRKTDCELFLLQKKIIDACGCYYLMYDRIDTKTQSCLSINQTKCIIEFFEDWSLGKIDINPLEECPPACSEVVYEHFTSSSDFTSDFYFEKLSAWFSNQSSFENLNESNFDEVQNHVTSVSIYFNEFSYTRIVETVKTSLPDLISGIGGISLIF
jgi:hypothetical protein